MTSGGGVIPKSKSKKEEIHEIKGHCPNCCQAIVVKIQIETDLD